MPTYVTIKNKRTGRKMGINLDVWNIEKERNKNNKEYEFEEVQPMTITIPRRSTNQTITQPEKKSQDVADSVIPKEVPENREVELTPESIKQANTAVTENKNPISFEEALDAALFPNQHKAPKEVAEIEQPEKKEEPKKRGRPKRV